MRDLKKNQRQLWYALYQDKIPIVDENGDETGTIRQGIVRRFLFMQIYHRAKVQRRQQCSERI